jgi:transcriptional regulator with XRE-family HTH domain
MSQFLPPFPMAARWPGKRRPRSSRRSSPAGRAHPNTTEAEGCDFAHLAGIHRARMGMLENARIDPKLSTLLGVANALDVSISGLFKDRDRA